jgi:transketolase
MRNTFINELLKEAIKDPSIMLLVGDLGYGVIDEFAQKLPKQYINFGINEQSMMSAAAGMASKGFKPFVYSIGNFPTFRCLEQIRNDVSYMNLNVTIVALGAGFAYGTAGYSHHLIEDIGPIFSLPNMSVYSPSDPLDIKRIFTHLVNSKGPKYLRLGKGGEKVSTAEFEELRPGVMMKPGRSPLAVVSTGAILTEVCGALQCLEDINIEPSLYSVSDLVAAQSLVELEQYNIVFTVEEHVISGGFGSIINTSLNSSNSKVLNIGINKVNSQVSGSPDFLRASYGLDAKGIAKSIELNLIK